MSVLIFDKVSKTINNVNKLSNVSFAVSEGDFYSLIGDPGSGKHTALKLILDFYRPDSGEIKIFGRDNKKYSKDIKKDMICVFADPEFLNISVNSFLDKYFISDTINKFDIENLFAEYRIKLSQRLSELSFKQKKFIFLIRAVFLRPKLLVVEQPFKGLDSKMSNLIKQYFIELNKDGTTILLIDDNLKNADSLCNKLSFIHNGVIVERVNDCKNLRNSKYITVTSEQNITPMLMVLQAENVDIQNNVYKFQYDGSISLLIKALNCYEINDININNTLDSKILYKY